MAAMSSKVLACARQARKARYVISERGAITFSPAMTRRPASENGNGRNTTASAIAKSVALAAMPSASTTIDSAPNRGERARARAAPTTSKSRTVISAVDYNQFPSVSLGYSGCGDAEANGTAGKR